MWCLTGQVSGAHAVPAIYIRFSAVLTLATTSRSSIGVGLYRRVQTMLVRLGWWNWNFRRRNDKICSIF